MSKEPRNWLLISENFVTLQGEGVSTGQRAYFLRLGACNQHCRWCDTAYTWAYSEHLASLHESGVRYDAALELRREPIVDIANDIIESHADLLVITGGEPILQLEAIDQLISLLNEFVGGPRVEIETAGTLLPAGLQVYRNVTFNVSPKLESSGNPLDLRFKPEVLTSLAHEFDSRFKFVPDTRGTFGNLDSDIDEIKGIVKECGIGYDRVTLMPCGITERDVVTGMKLLAPIVLENHWRLSTRLHILIYGNERGT